MRQKLSITIKEEILQKIDELLKDATYRNKSHIVEIALQRFLEGKQ